MPSLSNEHEKILGVVKQLSERYDYAAFVLPGSPEFTAETTGATYWSTTLHELQPLSVFKPKSATDIASVLPSLVELGCRLGIRSGGHSTTLHANTASNGVLISFSNLDGFSFDQQSGIAQLGPGQRWGDVYRKLEPYGQTAVGGRYKDVGVGGFLLGGGLSHLSNKYGFGADNVVNFEVVLADGNIVNANENEHKDLFWALKGGSNNFGVVTRFDIKTYTQSTIWGGMHVLSENELPELMNNIDEFQTSGQLDENAAMCPSFIWGSSLGTSSRMCSVMIYYGESVTEKPTALKGVWELPAIHSTLRNATHQEFATELAATNSTTERHQFMVGTVKARNGASKLIYDVFFQRAEDVGLYSKIRYCALTLQPISASIMAQSDSPMADNQNAPAIWWAIHVEYDKADIDGFVTQFCQDTYKSVQEAASKVGLGCDFIFLNDSGEGQDVMKSYGSAQLEKLRDVSRKYDPNGVFQKVVSGCKLGMY